MKLVTMVCNSSGRFFKYSHCRSTECRCTIMKTTDEILFSTSASTALGKMIGDDDEEEEAIVFKTNQFYDNNNNELYGYEIDNQL